MTLPQVDTKTFVYEYSRTYRHLVVTSFQSQTSIFTLFKNRKVVNNVLFKFLEVLLVYSCVF